MDKKLKAKWVKALRSGEYRQGNALLLSNNGKYCCLGVLGVICGVPRHALLSTQMPAGLEELHADKYPKNEGALYGELAVLNDTGVPFEMIAGLIDSAL